MYIFVLFLLFYPYLTINPNNCYLLFPSQYSVGGPKKNEIIAHIEELSRRMDEMKRQQDLSSRYDYQQMPPVAYGASPEMVSFTFYRFYDKENIKHSHCTNRTQLNMGRPQSIQSPAFAVGDASMGTHIPASINHDYGGKKMTTVEPV